MKRGSDEMLGKVHLSTFELGSTERPHLCAPPFRAGLPTVLVLVSQLALSTFHLSKD